MSAPRVLGWAGYYGTSGEPAVFACQKHAEEAGFLRGVPLISQADASAETAKLRALLVGARGIIGNAVGPFIADDTWANRRNAWLTALAETESST